VRQVPVLRSEYNLCVHPSDPSILLHLSMLLEEPPPSHHDATREIETKKER